MKNLVLVLIIGIAIGMILYPVLFPRPEIEVPPPVLVPGKKDTVYVEKTEKVPVLIPAKPDTVYLNDEPVIYDVIDTVVTFFDGKVDIGVKARAVKQEKLELIGLKLIETLITQVDTLIVHYPVPEAVPWYRTWTFGFVGGIVTGWGVIYAIIRLYTTIASIR